MSGLVTFLQSVAAENDCPCGLARCSKQRIRAEALAYAASVESAMALPGKLREDAERIARRMSRPAVQYNEVADERRATLIEVADKLEAIFGPAPLAGEGNDEVNWGNVIRNIDNVSNP